MFVESDHDEFGVYELGDDAKSTVYYGSGKLKTRLMDHLHKKECPLAKQYRHEYFGSEQASRAREEQLLGEYKATHGGKLPTYNERIG